jgi:hypothetical protein
MKNSSATSRSWILLGVAILLLMGAGRRHRSLVDMRRDRDLQQVAPEDTTPLVAITTVAFGGFRGLVADALWVRANKLQDEGQYFELVQLSKWITQLEPRVPEVWSFQGWNLAYNISVLFPEYEDRWRWVNHGIDLLRKDGLTHNPNSPELHWDIGWMFQHKIGMEFDSAHKLYKKKLAEQVEAILPQGRLTHEEQNQENRTALKDAFTLSMDKMLSLDERYGPLDWRLPEPHYLYWSSEGIPYAKGRNDRSLRRMKMQALGVLMRSGRLLSSSDGSVRINLPRKELMTPLLLEYEDLLASSPTNRYLEKGYANFLNDAMMLLADYGDLSGAYFYYEKLAVADDEVPPGRENFQALVQYQLTRDPAELNFNQAMTRIIALLTQSIETKDPIRSRGFKQMAEQVHRIYSESRVSDDHRDRTGLPSFEDIVSLLNASQENS